MLNFLGIGSAFNTALGNNCAYIMKGDSLLLVDCGGLTFGEIQRRSLLEGIQHIDILITHTHPDHIGSLGDLIFYAYYILGIKVHIHFPRPGFLRPILDAFGVESSIYLLDGELSFELTDGDFTGYRIDFVAVKHIDIIPSFGFYLADAKGEKLFYSGDTAELSREALDLLMKNEIQWLYHDTSSIDHENSIHYAFSRLKAHVPPEFRSKVFCMHFDKHVNYDEILQSGFNVVKRDA